MSNAAPIQPQRRSMLDRWHLSKGAEFVELGGSRFVARYGADTVEAEAARHLGVCDLSLMPRVGVTGAGAAEWLTARGFAIPATPNRCVQLAGGDSLARLSEIEYLLLGVRLLRRDGAPDGFPTCSDLPAQSVYVLPRLDSHCCLALTGRKAFDLLSRVCAIDSRPRVFADGSVAQTSIAHTSGIVVRRDLGDCPCFLALANSVAAEYFLEAMLDAMKELNGAPIGLRALQTIGEPES